jgi:hypothetical protein
MHISVMAPPPRQARAFWRPVRLMASEYRALIQVACITLAFICAHGIAAVLLKRCTARAVGEAENPRSVMPFRVPA